jgi:ABC-type uncharacterized transport system permease subunit
MKKLGTSKAIRIRFLHAIVSGFLTGLIGWWSLSGLVNRVTELNFHLGMTLRWTSVSLIGVGLLVGFVVALMMSVFDDG